MKAVIIQPPLPLSRDFIDYPYLASLGAYQAAAVLARHGCQIEVFDGFDRRGADLHEQGKRAWLGEDSQVFLNRIRTLAADLAVINGNPFLMGRPGHAWLRELVAVLARSGASLVVLADMYTGGMHYIEYDSDGLLGRIPGLDLVLRYEGERLLARLADSLAAGDWPDRGSWYETEPFPLDDLPDPAFELMDHQAYFDFLRRVLSSPWRPGPIPAEPARTLPLVTARGCPFGCIFCTRNPGLPGERRQVRAIPWPRVAGWITDWVMRFDLKRVVILDEVANLDPKRFDALLHLLGKLKLRVDFPNGLRADLLRESHVHRLSGLTASLKVSMESASPRVQQEVLDKNLDPTAVERVAVWCRRAGLPLQVHYMIGIPGERREEIVDTLRTAARLKEQQGAHPLLQFATPLPGSRLEQICRQQGLVTVEPEDLHACFQQRSVIRTSDFNPAFLGQAADVLRRRLKPSEQPKVIVNLTYRCNNHCVFCAVGDRPARDADFPAVVAALRRYRQEGFQLLDIDGGEPTLHPRLFEVIQTARELGYRRISLTTNGRRLSYPAFAQELARTGLDEVLVSLHAPDADLQAQLTNEPDSFRQTVEGIGKILAAMGDPRKVGVNTTLVAANLPQVHRLGDLLASMGVVRFNLQVVTPFGRAQASQMPDTRDLENTLVPLLQGPLAEKMRIQVINCPPCLLPGFEEAAAEDFHKADRDMVFVGEPGQNLQGFLAQRRRQDERCDNCLYSLLCPGFYLFNPDEGTDA